MLLAIDYDETYTRDPEFWDQVISLATKRGHSVICATMRSTDTWESEEVIEALADKVENIIFTNRKAKFYAVHAAGYMPSVWIDDSPNFVHNDAKC